MSLYFGDKTTVITTLMILALIAYMVILIVYRDKISKWGRHILILDLYGVAVCTYAATRDGLHLTIQNAIDGSVAPGIFPLICVPTIAGVIGASMILISAIVCLFVWKQDVRKKLVFITIAGIILKIVVVEISRIVM